MWRKSSILVTCCDAPLVNKVFLKSGSRVLSVSRESCAWSSGARVRSRCRHAGIRGHSVRFLELLGSRLPGRRVLALFTATLHLLLGLLFCRYNLAVGFSVSSRASRKAAEAASTNVSCARKTPAVATPRIMSRIRGLAAINQTSEVCWTGNINGPVVTNS